MQQGLKKTKSKNKLNKTKIVSVYKNTSLLSFQNDVREKDESDIDMGEDIYVSSKSNPRKKKVTPRKSE